MAKYTRSLAQNFPNIDTERYNRLVNAARCGLADLLAQIEKGGCDDAAKKSAVELYDALEDLGEDAEAYSFDVECCREELAEAGFEADEDD